MKVVKDFWFSSYLSYKGYTPVKWEEYNYKRYKYYFNIDDETWNELKIEYVNSETCKIKYEQEKLKDLAFNDNKN